MAKPVSIAASPNAEADDVKLAWDLLWQSGQQQDWENVKALEQKASAYLGVNAVAFDSARSSFYVLVKALGLQAGDEVILPAFSCMVVANAALWADLKPVYADCDLKTFNYDLADLKKKITPKTKAIMVQHSFGIAEDMAKIREIAGTELLIIEDLAHSLGGKLSGKQLGTLGDAAILTFGIEKVISGVRGGMAVTADPEVAQKMLKIRETLPSFPSGRTRVALWNPVFWSLTNPLYYLGVGKATLGRLLVWLGHKLGILGNMIEDSEYDTVKPEWFPAKPSPALAKLAAQQFEKLERFNEHRRAIAANYAKELGVEIPNIEGAVPVFLRFPVLVSDKSSLMAEARKHKVILGDWYKTVLFAPAKAYPKLGYTPGSCPNAEYSSAHIVNLPTYIGVTEQDALKIASLVKPYLL